MKVKNEKDVVVEIQENGETVESFRPLDGSQISDASQQGMVTAVENKDWDTFCRKVFEILTGQTVDEAKN